MPLSPQEVDRLIAADKRVLWHPFTPQADWCAPEHRPLLLVSGQGSLLRDQAGRDYIDGNASIWTNVHGHNHPAINAAIVAQLERVAHTSFLGFSHPLAIELAEKLVALFPRDSLTRVFYSDDGSTAMECAMKMALQYWQLEGQPGRNHFIAFDQAYHGDTLGAAALGDVEAFHGRFAGLGLTVHHVSSVEALRELASEVLERVAAISIEPLIQGVAGMKPWPSGMLRELRAFCDERGILLIFDEVMTGFGRTGKMFAGEHEGVTADLMALAKGLTGGYLPLAATLTTEAIYEAFLGRVEEGRTFYYGHSYTANPLGCAAALASLQIFEEERTLESLVPKIALLGELLHSLCQRSSFVHAVRQCGFIVGIELRHPDGQPFAFSELRGARVCLAARDHGLLTRPIGDVIVLMPPYCITTEQIEMAVAAIDRGIEEVMR